MNSDERSGNTAVLSRVPGLSATFGTGLVTPAPADFVVRLSSGAGATARPDTVRPARNSMPTGVKSPEHEGQAVACSAVSANGPSVVRSWIVPPPLALVILLPRSWNACACSDQLTPPRNCGFALMHRAYEVSVEGASSGL